MSWQGLNRRQFPRAQFPCLIKIIAPGQDSAAILTHTENIGVGGVGVIVKDQFDLFEPVRLELDLVDGNELIRCHGRIVWVVRRKAIEQTKPSFYDLGIEFTDIAEGDRVRMSLAVDHLTKHLKKVKL